MTGSTYKSSTGLCILVLSLLYLFDSQTVVAAPQPLPPGMLYREENYAVDVPQPILDRLKQIVDRKEEKIEKEIAELAEEQMELQAIIDAKSRSQREHQQPQDFSVEDPETLPVPAAIYHNAPLHSRKRTSYMALCHFKICNMGRKRQM